MQLLESMTGFKVATCVDVLFFEALAGVCLFLFLHPASHSPPLCFQRQGTDVPANQQPHHPHPAHRESVPDGTNIQGHDLGSGDLQRKGARALIRSLVAIRFGSLPRLSLLDTAICFESQGWRMFEGMGAPAQQQDLFVPSKWPSLRKQNNCRLQDLLRQLHVLALPLVVFHPQMRQLAGRLRVIFVSHKIWCAEDFFLSRPSIRRLAISALRSLRHAGRVSTC